MTDMKTEFKPETPVVVSLQGHSGSGKSHLAKLLAGYGWAKVSFAQMLRDHGERELGSLDSHDPQLMKFITNKSKQTTLEDPFYITRYGMDFVSEAIGNHQNVVVDDLRMMSEWMALKSMALNGTINWFPILILRSDIDTEPRNQLDVNLMHLPKIILINPGDVKEEDPRHALNQLVDMFRTRPPYGHTA
jgi:energy-coupling factor transporter ATP-binding protein EcfA2